MPEIELAAVDRAEGDVGRRGTGDDAARAIRFMAVKAAIFILIPVLASLIAVWWVLG